MKTQQQLLDYYLVTSYIGLLVRRNFAQDIHQDSSQVNDCHVIFILYTRLDERVGDFNDCDIPIFIGVNDTCQQNRFCDDIYITGIFLGNVLMVFFASSYRLSFDISFYLLLEKHMPLQHHLMLFICKITPVHRNKGVPQVKLIHIALGYCMGLIYPLFQICID